MKEDGTFVYTPPAAWTGVDTFTYKVNDGTTDSGLATVTINVNAAADVTFDVSSTASISEDLTETATFTVALGGDPLVAGLTASVDINASGSALSGTDYDNFVAALVTAAAGTTGVAFDGTDTLTFDATFNGGSGTGNFQFTVDALDDSTVEGTETIVATLTNESVSNGTATLGVDTASTNVTETDADVTFGVTSTASIDEDAGATATFTVTLGGDALVGANTASVDINATGTAGSGVDYDDFVAALVAAAGATAGVSPSTAWIRSPSTAPSTARARGPSPSPWTPSTMPRWKAPRPSSRPCRRRAW